MGGSVHIPEGHSPLGASAAHRFMACPGSVRLSYGIVDEDSDHAARGTAAHFLGAYCLKNGNDAWEFIGCDIDPRLDCFVLDGPDPQPHWIAVDKKMADAVQVYLDFVRQRHSHSEKPNVLVERRFHCPDIHELFYGTSDAIRLYTKHRHLDVIDYKNGAGVVVEAENNPQLSYYGVGVLNTFDLWDDVDEVTLWIVQPNGFHYAGPVRPWSTTPDNLRRWTDETLVPAMDRALASRDTKSGEHCRFCPAVARACPQIMADMTELEKMVMELKTADAADELSNAQIGRFLDLLDLAKIVGKKANATAFNRMQAGHRIPGYKLAAAKVHRQFKDGAEAAAKEKFGSDAYEPASLKSPAQIEQLPEGKAFCAQWAFKPDAGLTVVKGEDSRPEVSRDTKSLFQPVKRSKQ